MKPNKVLIFCALAAALAGFRQAFREGSISRRMAGSNSDAPASVGALSGSAITETPADPAAVNAVQEKENSVLKPGPAITSPLEAGPSFLSSILSRRELGIDLEQFATIRTAGKGELLLDLGEPQGAVAANFTEILENADGGYTAVGKIRGAPLSRVLVTVQDQAVVGEITVSPSREFMILPGGPEGVHELRRINRGVLPVCSGELEPDLVADTAQHPSGDSHPAPGLNEEDETAADTGTTSSPSPGPGSGGTLPAADVTVDVIILYTPAAVTRLGSLSGLLAAMNYAVADANLVYQSSGVSCALRLAHHQQVFFTATTMNSDILKLKNAGDGVMDEAPVLREQYAADVVSLWHNYPSDYSGIAMLCRSGAMAKASALNIVDVDYAVHARSWVHEVGHNMGLNHDLANATGLGARASAYGYRFAGAGTGQVYITIMAYPPGLRIPYFSNPDITFDGAPTGTSQANNAGTAAVSKNWLAAVRSPVAPVISQQPVDSSVTAGSSVILSVAATGSPPAYQWLSGAPGGSLSPLAGASGPTLSVAPSVSTCYQCVVQNGAGTVSSNVVTVTIQ